MLLTFEAVRRYDDRSHFFPGLLIFGGLGIALGFAAKATCGYAVSEQLRDPLVQQILPRLRIGELNKNNVLFLFFGIGSDLASWCWPVAFVGMLVLIEIAYQIWRSRTEGQRSIPSCFYDAIRKG